MRENATRFNRILLLTDLTDKSQSALGFARAFAGFYDSCLFVLHVLPQPEPGSSSLGFHGENKHAAEIARARLEAVGKALRDEGISVQVRLCRGSVTARTILKSIRTIRPDLIIQGSGGIDDLRRAFVGSTAEEVLRSTDRPVLTVPARLRLPASTSLRFDRILFATDFGTAVRTTADHALSLAQDFRARINLCHVHIPDSKSTWSVGEVSAFFDTELHRLLSPSVSEQCDPKCVVKFGKPSETILQLADTEKCDLIVLGAHARGPLGTRGRPGTVFRVIAKASCPVLTISSAKREDHDHDHDDVELIEV